MCDWYDVHGYRFGVRSSSEGFAGWLRYALARYGTEPTPEEEDDYPTYSVVVEDGMRGADRVGRRYNILYLGTWDIARTLDLRFLARCLLRQIDSIGYHQRDDAVFLESGVVEVDGSASLVHSYLVPALCAARRRAEKRGIHAPGGMVAALDLETGELVAPRLSLDIPGDALERLEASLPTAVNDIRDRFSVEEGERRRIGALIDVTVGHPGVTARHRAEVASELAGKVRNLDVLGGRALRSIAATVAEARCSGIMWSSANELIDVIARAAEPATAPTVREIRPRVDEERRRPP